MKQQRLVNEDDGTFYAFFTSISITQKLQTLIDKKVDYLNSSCHKYNGGLSGNQFEKNALQLYSKTPRVSLVYNAENSQIKPKPDHKQIVDAQRKQIKEMSLNSDVFGEFSATQKLHLLENITINTYQETVDIGNTLDNFVQETKTTLSIIEHKVDQVVAPKQKKIKIKPLKRRDVITNSIFAQIINDKKPLEMQKLIWLRFRVACVLMFFTGLRVSEVAYTTQEMINNLKQVARYQFYQSKVNSIRTVFISTKAYKYLDLIEQDIIDVYSAKNPNPITKSEFDDPEESLQDEYEEMILYPHIARSKDKWVKLLNKRLRIYAE